MYSSDAGLDTPAVEFGVPTGICYGFVMPFFVIVSDRAMKNTTSKFSSGTRWGHSQRLKTWNYMYIALFSHSQRHFQDKSSRLYKYAKYIELKINKKNIKYKNGPRPYK